MSLLLGLLLAPAGASADVLIAQGPPRLGYVNVLAWTDPASPGVRIVEEVDGVEVPAATAPTAIGVEANPAWTCRPVRTFRAIAGDERSEPLVVTTPPCEERVRVTARPGVRVGEDLRVSVVDKWELGDLGAEVCVVPPGGDRSCRTVELPATQIVAHAVFRATRAGRWEVEVYSSASTVYRTVDVARRSSPRRGPTVLLTGDSMMISTRHVLPRRLPAGTRTVDDIYVGSGLSRPFVIDWATLPRRQVRAFRPDAVVVSIGMSDGRDIDGLRCCGEDWVDAYAARARRVMRTYTRGGPGAVVWLTLPYSRDPARHKSETAVNAALVRAAAGLGRVAIVDLAAVLTPGGAYQEHLVRDDGTRVRVREDDGIHITRAGARIASRLVVRALRRLGVVGP